jgi:hypothetical protein
MLVVPSHLLPAISIFKIINHILNTSYLPKLGRVKQGEERGVNNFVQMISFENIPQSHGGGKQIVLKLSYLNHRPVHLPCKTDEEKKNKKIQLPPQKM